jgi:hypothetical protein
MKIHNWYLLILFCGFQLTTFAQSSTKASSQIKMLSKGADVILTGKVTKQNSIWNKNKTRIYTEATLQVDEYIKGNSGSNSVVVTYPGGEVGDVGEWYSHMPSFKKDEEILLFAKKDKQDSHFKVFDGENGKMTLYRDKKTGEKITSSNVKVSTLKKEIKSYVDKQQ